MRHLLMLAALVFIAACRPAAKPAAESADTAAAQAPRPTGIDTAAQARDTAGQRPDTTRRDSLP